ncbi:unnamed protein product, partial [Ceratitis capitata]
MHDILACFRQAKRSLPHRWDVGKRLSTVNGWKKYVLLLQCWFCKYAYSQAQPEYPEAPEDMLESYLLTRGA